MDAKRPGCIPTQIMGTRGGGHGNDGAARVGSWWVVGRIGMMRVAPTETRVWLALNGTGGK